MKFSVFPHPNLVYYRYYKNAPDEIRSKMVVDSVSLNSWLHMWARMCQVQHDDYDGDDHDGHDHDYYGDHLDHGGRG